MARTRAFTRRRARTSPPSARTSSRSRRCTSTSPTLPAWTRSTRTTSHGCCCRSSQTVTEQALTEADRTRAEQLRAELHEHGRRYYVLDDPVIGDDEYD